MTNKPTRLSILALVFSIWFALTAWIWTYYFCLLFSWPFGIAALYLLLKFPKGSPPDLISRIAGVILALGVIISFAALAVYQ